jgi:hypothetical protein
VRLSDVDTGRLLGLKYKFVCCLKLAMDMVGGGIWEFVNDTDRSGFLERELMGLGVDAFLKVRIHECASGPVPIYTF